jgi:hypothetical protein
VHPSSSENFSTKRDGLNRSSGLPELRTHLSAASRVNPTCGTSPAMTQAGRACFARPAAPLGTQPAGVEEIPPLFRIVINNEICNHNVSTALSPQIPITAMWSNRTMRRPAPWFRLRSAPRTRSYPPPCGEGGERSEPGGGGAVMLKSRLKDGPPPPTPPHKGEGSRPSWPLAFDASHERTPKDSPPHPPSP